MTTFRQWAKGWTGALVLLLAVVFVGSAYHVHQPGSAGIHDVATIVESDRASGSSHGVDNPSEKSDRHDKSTCQACTLAAQLIEPPVSEFLTIATFARDPYQQVHVEQAGLDPPGLDRPPIMAFA